MAMLKRQESADNPSLLSKVRIEKRMSLLPNHGSCSGGDKTGGRGGVDQGESIRFSLMVIPVRMRRM